MTNIKIYKKNNDFVRVTCDGHTGYGVAGEDIVCSALSSIVQTAVLGIMMVAGVNAQLDRDDSRGYLDCVIPNNLSNKQRNDTNVILGTMLCGIQDLYEGYSDFIELEVISDVY